MKKTFAVGAGLLTLVILFVFACHKPGKEEEVAKPDELPSTITTVYEREIGEVDSMDMFADHIWKIEVISLNDALLTPFKNDTTWDNHDIQAKLDLSRPIRRFHVDYSAMKFIEVPLVNNSKLENIYIFTFKDQFIFVRGTLDTLVNGNIKILFESLQGAAYYGLEVNTEGYMGNFIVENEMPFDETFTHATEQDRAGSPFSQCQQMYPTSFVWCMQCSLSTCWANFGCAFICGFGLPSQMIYCTNAWAIRCSRIKGIDGLF